LTGGGRNCSFKQLRRKKREKKRVEDNSVDSIRKFDSSAKKKFCFKLSFHFVVVVAAAAAAAENSFIDVYSVSRR
jgi:DNA recombination-dependent growth factor C